MKYYQLNIEFMYSKNQDWSDQFPGKYATLEEAKKAAEEAKENLSCGEPVDSHLLGQDLPEDTNMYTYDYFRITACDWDSEKEESGKDSYETDWAIIRLNK